MVKITIKAVVNLEFDGTVYLKSMLYVDVRK